MAVLAEMFTDFLLRTLHQKRMIAALPYFHCEVSQGRHFFRARLAQERRIHLVNRAVVLFLRIRQLHFNDHFLLRRHALLNDLLLAAEQIRTDLAVQFGQLVR